jgi:hypothetical protein
MSPTLMDETPPALQATANGDIAFFAHSLPNAPQRNWQPLAEHSTNMGHMAGDFASVLGAREMGKASDYLHDLGKYTLSFQERLRGSLLAAGHSTSTRPPDWNIKRLFSTRRPKILPTKMRSWQA